MKSLNKENPNCINNPAECIQWNSGNIDYLGICNGDYLPEIIWEIVNKLQAIAGSDLSQFDIDSLLTICNQKAPLEVTLISILTLLRDNQVCLKSYIDILSQQIQELSNDKNITINLQCLATSEYNLGVTQEQLNQLVVDKLCAQQVEINLLKTKSTSLDSRVTLLENAPPVAAIEPTFSTCVDGVVKKTSDQVKSIANTFCNYRIVVGDTTEIAKALSNVPAVWSQTSFLNELITRGLISKWDVNPTSLADNYNNLLLAYTMLQQDVANILATCCAPTCDKIKIGFSIIPGDETNDFIIRFRNTDGTSIPSGYTDSGSTITFTDIDGVSYGPFTIDVTQEESESYNLTGLNLNKAILISINAKVTNGSLFCEKCVAKSVNLNDAACPVCEVTATGGQVTIVYQVY